jgi:hypothetical protein
MYTLRRNLVFGGSFFLGSLLGGILGVLFAFNVTIPQMGRGSPEEWIAGFNELVNFGDQVIIVFIEAVEGFLLGGFAGLICGWLCFRKSATPSE